MHPFHLFYFVYLWFLTVGGAADVSERGGVYVSNTSRNIPFYSTGFVLCCAVLCL